jgi:hypothetical protein
MSGYVVYFSLIQRPGAPFNAMRERHFRTLDGAKCFMRAKIHAFVEDLSPQPANNRWRALAKLELQAIDDLAAPNGHGSLGPFWTTDQGGCDGRVSFLSPAPSMTIACE